MAQSSYWQPILLHSALPVWQQSIALPDSGIQWPVADTLLSILASAIIESGNENLLETFETCLLPLERQLADPSDLLGRLNVLQSLDALARSPVGLQYLERSQALQQVSNILKPTTTAVDSRSIDDGELLVSFAAKFIGRLAQSHPDLFVSLDERLNFTDSLVRQLLILSSTADPSALTFASNIFDALGMIGSCSATSAKRMEQRQPQAFQAMHQWFQRTTGEPRVPVARCLAAIVQSTTDEQLARRLVGEISRSGSLASAIGDITKMALNAFDDIRLAAISLLRAMAYHCWGVKVG